MEKVFPQNWSPVTKKLGTVALQHSLQLKNIFFVKWSIAMGYAYTIHWFYPESPHPSPTKCPSTCVRWRFQISLCCYTYRFAIQVHFSSVSQLCLTLRIHGLQHARIPCPSPTPKLAQTHVHWVGDAIQPSHPLLSPSPVFNLSQGLFQWVTCVFTSGGQSIGASPSLSVLPVNIQDRFPLGSTGWISLEYKGLSSIFSNTTVQKLWFFNSQLSLWSNSHIHTWLL